MSLLLSAAGAFVDRIKINAIAQEERCGKLMWVKQRRWIARPVMMVANVFFALARVPMRTVSRLRDWQQWEIDCFTGLHPEFEAFTEGVRGVCADDVPGVNLSRFLDTGSLTPAMTAAAARELRRAHGWHCEGLGGPWSHGDPHIGNFVYDAEEDRARIIDFEVRHHSLPADVRHCDDVLIFIQDLAGRCQREQWLPNAEAFLQAYGRPEITRKIVQMLVLPRGIPRLWWMVRTSFISRHELTARIDALRESLRRSLA